MQQFFTHTYPLRSFVNMNFVLCATRVPLHAHITPAFPLPHPLLLRLTGARCSPTSFPVCLAALTAHGLPFCLQCAHLLHVRTHARRFSLPAAWTCCIFWTLCPLPDGGPPTHMYWFSPFMPCVYIHACVLAWRCSVFAFLALWDWTYFTRRRGIACIAFTTLWCASSTAFVAWTLHFTCPAVCRAYLPGFFFPRPTLHFTTLVLVVLLKETGTTFYFSYDCLFWTDGRCLRLVWFFTAAIYHLTHYTPLPPQKAAYRSSRSY